MTFIWPALLLTLLLIPLLVWMYIWLQRRRQRILDSFGSSGFIKGGAVGRLGSRRHIPAMLFLAGLSAMLVALARPQTVVSLPRMEGTIILAFDVSGSMAADDLDPTRMEAAKAVAQEFVERQPSSVQVGIVAFSDGGLAVQSPTNDQEALLAAINRLSPQRGTSLAGGIFAAINLIDGIPVSAGSAALGELSPTPPPPPTPTPMPSGSYIPAVILLLTDGENNVAPDPLIPAQVAADRGVRIYTIGIGSAAGTTLEVNGFVVHTQLDEGLLKGISQVTGGEYFNAENEQDLQSIYENIDPQLVIKPEKIEITSILAGVSILMLLIGGGFSLLWFGRLP